MARKSEAKEAAKKGTWLTYRPDIKVLDCTIRDGGLINACQFEDKFVRAIYETCSAAGVDYMEIGYKGSRKVYSSKEYGPWKFCDEDDLRRIVGDGPRTVKLSAMADAERTDYHEDILPKDQSVLDMIRVATYIHQIPTALDMIKSAHDKGYETTLNLMGVSTVQENELSEALDILARSEVNVIYIVDSFGSLYSEEVQVLARKFIQVAGRAGKQVGIHSHNNQQLAYANTIEGLILGVSYLDVTMGGLGRGAGNCPTELLLGFLKNPKFHIRPVLQCLQDHILPMKQKLKWGFDIPYMLTGQLNMHPRVAIEAVESDRTDFVGFYDEITAEE